MTICIASLTKDGKIVGIADRMRSTGEWEVDLNAPKIYPITSKIVIMCSGHSATINEIIDNIKQRIREVSTVLDCDINVFDPVAHKYPTITHISDLFTKVKNEMRLRHIEREILSPFGFNMEKFLSTQNNMSTDFVSRITNKINDFAWPEVDALICGIFCHGSFINFVGEKKTLSVSCFGFESIGSGSLHPDLLLMKSQHTANLSYEEALFNIYRAKRYSEIAPGVGKTHDLFVMDPKTGYRDITNDPLVELVKMQYESCEKKIADIIEYARSSLRAPI